MHADCFSKRKFEQFMRQRAAPGTGVTFAEIEVMLCNIPSRAELLQEEEEEKRDEQGVYSACPNIKKDVLSQIAMYIDSFYYSCI